MRIPLKLTLSLISSYWLLHGMCLLGEVKSYQENDKDAILSLIAGGFIKPSEGNPNLFEIPSDFPDASMEIYKYERVGGFNQYTPKHFPNYYFKTARFLAGTTRVIPTFPNLAFQEDDLKILAVYFDNAESLQKLNENKYVPKRIRVCSKT